MRYHYCCWASGGVRVQQTAVVVVSRAGHSTIVVRCLALLHCLHPHIYRGDLQHSKA